MRIRNPEIEDSMVGTAKPGLKESILTDDARQDEI